MTRTIAVIPARAGSKRVPDKNIRPLSGQPLIVWSIKAALGEPAIDQVIVSTDDVRAASMARELGVTVYDRPRELATDTSSTLDVLRQVGGRYAEERGVVPDVVVLLQPTSPLREADLIRRGLELMHADPAATSLLTVFPVRLFTGVIEDGCWRGNFPETTRSQELPVHYVPSGALYVYRYPQTIAAGTAWGTRVLPLIEAAEAVVNIDEEADFQRAVQVFAAAPDRYAHLLKHFQHG